MTDLSSSNTAQPRTKRCPHCGASNPASAEWCGQCLERFTPLEPSPAAPAPPGSPAPPTPPGAPSAPAGSGDQIFKKTEQGLVWVCTNCENPNPIAEQVCVVCGMSFAELVRPKVERPQRDPGTAALVSLFMPGAGHAYLGMWGQAAARAVVSLWALFVVVVSLLAKDQPGSSTMAFVFGVAAVGLWVVDAHDAYREANNEPSQAILKGRVFLYVVLGLLVLLMILLVSSGLRARG